MYFDIILQNNASKVNTIIRHQKNVSLNHLYLEFLDIDLDLPDGEYTYVCIGNTNEAIEYEIKTPILSSKIKYQDTEITFNDIHPRMGIVRIGTVEPIAEYDYENDNDLEFIYYEG